jgi:hypothetical protein
MNRRWQANRRRHGRRSLRRSDASQRRLRNRPFKEFRLGALRSRFPIHDFRALFDPEIDPAQRRDFRCHGLRVEDRLGRNLHVLAQLSIKVQPRVLFFRRRPDKSAQEQDFNVLGRIGDDLFHEIRDRQFTWIWLWHDFFLSFLPERKAPRILLEAKVELFTRWIARPVEWAKDACEKWTSRIHRAW